MIFVGAGVVLVSGGYLIDSVQGSSQHELAKDSAVQTHQSISEALQSGEAQNLGVGDDVDVTVLESGSITIKMMNSSGGACYGDDDRVEADLGAIVYDTPKGEVVYQGGAIWERTEAGLSTVRAPPIAYDDDTARISIQTVSADADSFEGEMARPNEEMQTKMAKETERLLTHCPANGYTDLKIKLTSPNYAERWENHFEERVNTTDNTDVYKSGSDTVVAEISNATNAHPSRGLRFEEIYAPDPPVVGDSGSRYANELNVTAAIANDGFTLRNASVELEIDGNVWTNSTEVPTTEAKNVTFGPDPPSWSELNNTRGLNTGETHEYTLTLNNADTGEVASASTGRFYLAESGGGGVSFFDDSHRLEDDEDTLVVNASLVNTEASPADDQTVEFQITDDRVNMTDPVDDDIDVPAYGGTKGLSYEINVSSLAAGTYEYQLHHEADDETLPRNFTINSPPPGSGSIVGDLRVEDIEPSTDYLKKGDPFSVRVQLYNTAANDTTTDVSIDLLDDDLSATAEDVTVGNESRTNETVELDGGDIADELETRTEHDYEVTIENEGDEESFNGTFVVLESGSSLQVDDHGTEVNGNWRWINATLANHGMEQGNDTATLTVYDNETDQEVGSIDTEGPVTIDSANETAVPFGFEVDELGGAYRYEVSYGEETVEGYFTEGEADTGDGNVSFTAPGNGTVSVLGTEISWYDDGGCGWLGCTPPQKGWAPTTVSTILQIDGEETVETFDNTAADESSYENVTNLNTYDTQDAIYTKDWTQTSGESATLTVSSSYWSVEDGTPFNTRDDGTEDVQPGHDIMDDEPSETVNAHAETNKHAVKVLEDGDEIPNPRTSGEDQRSAAEVLNQGATDRIDDDTLDLGPYEAVFLFELTTYSYDGMWNDSYDDAGDPDFNDVIALVSFNPDEPDDVNFDVGDHSLSIRPAEPDDPQNANDTAEQDIGINTSQSPGDGGNPSAPTPQNPYPGDPSESDEIDVDIGGVVIG